MWKQNIYFEEKKRERNNFRSQHVRAAIGPKSGPRPDLEPSPAHLPQLASLFRLLSAVAATPPADLEERQPPACQATSVILVLPKENKGRQLPSKEDEEGPADWIGKPSKLTAAYFLAKKP